MYQRVIKKLRLGGDSGHNTDKIRDYAHNIIANYLEESENEASFITEAGLLQNIITWAGITLTTLFGNFQAAEASPSDLHAFLEQVETTLEQKSKSIKMDNKFREIKQYNDGSGGGTFKINFSDVYLIEGDYQGAGENFNNYTIRVKKNPEASPEDINKWKQSVEKVQKAIKGIAPDLLNK